MNNLSYTISTNLNIIISFIESIIDYDFFENNNSIYFNDLSRHMYDISTNIN